MPDLVVAGNWKMNTNVSEAAALAAAVKDGAAAVEGVELVLCPPFVSLAAVNEAVACSAVNVCAQRTHLQASGCCRGARSAWARHARCAQRCLDAS